MGHRRRRANHQRQHHQPLAEALSRWRIVAGPGYAPALATGVVDRPGPAAFPLFVFADRFALMGVTSYTGRGAVPLTKKIGVCVQSTLIPVSPSADGPASSVCDAAC
jgi:hypothetical protein